MSYAGLTTNQLTPELLQQMQMMQDQQRKQQMAAALMNNNADPKTAYAGLSNAGSDLTGALYLKSLQAKNGPQTAGANYLPNDPTAGMKDQMGMPLSGAQPGQGWLSGLGKLFNLGGGA